MPEVAMIICFRCRKEGNHYRQTFTLKNGGVYICERTEFVKPR